MSGLAIRLRAAGVRLPVAMSPDPDEVGVLLDGAGRTLAVVDVDGERPDAEVVELATAIADAINAACKSPADRGGGGNPRPLLDLGKAPSMMEQRYGAKP